MIFYRQASLLLILFCFLFTLTFWGLRINVVNKAKTTFANEEKTPLIQERETVLSEVFSRPLRLGVFSVNSEKSILSWDEKALLEEMTNVEGSFGNLTFSANRLVFNKLANEVKLSEQVTFSIKSFGDFFAKESVVIIFDDQNIKSIECQGETSFDLLNGASPLKVSCIGQVVFDPQNSLVTWKGALNPEMAVKDDEVMQNFESEQFPLMGDHSQKVKAPSTRSSYGSKDCITSSSSTAVSGLNGEQVHLFEKNTHLFADQMVVSFDKETFQTKNCVLSGHVKLVNGDKRGAFALADELVYCTETGELYLTGKDNRRVLYSDEESQFEMSAEAVRYKKSSPAKKGYIQGVGDVRFLLGASEKEHLFKLFSFLEEE